MSKGDSPSVPQLARYFEDLVHALGGEPKLCANWVTGELSARLNREGLDISQNPISSSELSRLLARVVDRTISGKIAKEVFDAMWKREGDADQIIERKGLKQISDASVIEASVDRIIAANPAQVAE